MSRSSWSRSYTVEIDAAPPVIFDLLADLPNYRRWLPGSGQYGGTESVEPYPVVLGTRYHDGKPEGSGRSWWGTVTEFQRPDSIAFSQLIRVEPLRATR